MDQAPDLTLALKNAHGVTCTAPVMSISWGQVRAIFPRETAPVLLIGQGVDLGLRGGAIEGVAHVRGFVEQRVEDGERRAYVFRMDHADSAALDAAVNRRSSLRVTPAPDAPVRVVLRSRAGTVSALLRDLSEGGLSALVGREEEWILARAETVSVELRLPGHPGVIRREAEVRHRRLERTAIHYGMAFSSTVPGEAADRAALRSWVAERTQAMRARLDRGDAA